MASSLEPWISGIKISSGGDDPLSNEVKHKEKGASHCSLATSKLVRKKEGAQQGEGLYGQWFHPRGPPSSYKTPSVTCPDLPTTFLTIPRAKSFCGVICCSSCLSCIFSGKVGFFGRKVQVPRRTYMQIFTLHQAPGV